MMLIKENIWIFLSVIILMLLSILDFYLKLKNNYTVNNKQLLRKFLCLINYHKYRYYIKVIEGSNRNCRVCSYCLKKQYSYIHGASDV